MAKPSEVSNIYARHFRGVKGINTTANLSEMFSERMRAMLFQKLHELCTNRFKWDGLPDTVDPRYLEMTLFERGTVVFFDHENYGLLALAGTGSGLNHYNEPTTFSINTPNIHTVIPATEAVPIYPNYTRTPDIETALLYAHRISRMDVTIDVNTGNARQPRILVADDNTRLTAENFNRQVDAGVPTIKVNRDLDPSASVTALDMGVDPRMFDMLGIARTRVWNECMSLLGIKNSNQDKKERLVADEVTANDEQVGYMRAVNLNARQEAVRLINQKFGLNVSVDYDDDIFSGIEEKYKSEDVF